LEEIQRILSRLKRGLRQVSDDHRLEAVERYRKAFDGLNKRAPTDGGIHDLIHYPGQNPATTSEDIVPLVGYAIDHGLCIEIDYKSDGQGNGTRRMVEPVSEDHAMLYAYCRSRKGDRVFRLQKIEFARLTGERAQHAKGS
jgi:predicted DNA-binding transcriptional regulator YafY